MPWHVVGVPSSVFGDGPPTDSTASRGSRIRSATLFHPLSSARGRGNLGSDGHLIDDGDLPANRNEVLMALEMKTNGTVGCAYFVAATATLYLQDDTRITGFELVESLLFQAQPTSIIIPSRAPEIFIDYLDRQSRGSTLEGSDCEERGFALRFVASSDFNSVSGMKALTQLDELGHQQPRSTFFKTAVEDTEGSLYYGDARARSATASERNERMHLGTCINLDNHVTLGCAGALIHDLERKQAAAVSKKQSPFQIKSILTVSYKNCMFVTADTLVALQIFHPALGRGFGKRMGEGKENNAAQDSRSVFDLFHSLALTAEGRGKLREIFVRPSTDRTVIDARHQSISSLLHPENSAVVMAIRAVLKQIKNMRPLLLHLRRGLLPSNFSSIKQSTWANLLDFCSNVLQIIRTGNQTLHGSCDVVSKALGTIDPRAIFQVKEALTRSIDFQESRSAGRNVIVTGVNQELDVLMSAYNCLQTRLEDTCESYRSQLPKGARGDIVGCIFHPQMGYLLVTAAALRAGITNSTSGSIITEESIFDTWEEALQEDGLVYFKTNELGDIDSEFGDLAGRIIDLEVEIFHRLGSEVLEKEDALLQASDAIGDIDSILALASGAEILHLSRPQMTRQNVLYVKKGRHLLQEFEPRIFVPNDCRLAGGLGVDVGAKDEHGGVQNVANVAPNVVLLTGPNHSGKSVYLKQIATIVYLAHVGSFVPAEEAIIGITDKILTRIATRESVSRDESTFGVDLRQAAFSINFATRRSLVLIDEFGKGTATADGAALFDALLNHFLYLVPNNTPRVLAATHFHEVFESSSFEQHPHLGLAHMSVTVDPDASRPEKRVRFLHVLQEGRSTGSFGCHCAAISGVAPSVVERADKISGLLAHGVSLERICLGRSTEDVEKLQENEDQARFFLAEMAEALDASPAWQTSRNLLGLVFKGRARHF